jgi:hypothetical protein
MFFLEKPFKLYSFIDTIATVGFDHLIDRGYNWLDNYLKNNSQVINTDKNICN